MKIAVVNQSTLVSDNDVQRMTAAVRLQLRRDFAPKWYRAAPTIRVYKTLAAVPADAWVIAVLDDSDAAGALGYHDETPDGRPYGRVFCRETLTHGGTPTTGANSVSVTFSHEVLELLADPNVNLWVDSGGANEIAVEVGDPVEATSYDINGVAVSNFVLQSYFDVQSKAAVFDFLGLLKAPWTMLPGGYLIKRSAGKVTQQFGEKYPEWKVAGKADAAARTRRRGAGLTPGALVGAAA